MTFYIGQKVVCVDDDSIESDGLPRLREGRVYTVRSVAASVSPSDEVLRHPRYPGGPIVRLQEVRDRPNDAPYAAERFRPVVERKTDIGIFKAMLSPAKAEVPA